MTCDVNRLGFDISGSAAAYAILAGVLAGFAFTAIAAILPGTLPRRFGIGPSPVDVEVSDRVGQPSRDADKHILISLFAAFLALIAATIEYGQLAGERACSLILGRAAAEEMLGSVALGFAMLILLYALVLLIDHVGVGADVPEHFRFLAAVLAPPFGLFLIGKGWLAIAEAPWRAPPSPDALYRPQEGPFPELVAYIAAWTPLLLGLICLGMWIIGARRTRRRRRPQATGFAARPGTAPGEPAHPDGRARGPRAAAMTVLQYYPYAPLVLSLVAVIRSTALSSVDPNAHVSHPELWVWVGVCTVFFLLHTAVLSFVRVPEQGARWEPAQALLRDVEREPWQSRGEG